MKTRETLKNETLAVGDIIKAPLKDHIDLLYNHFVRYGAAVQKLDISQDDLVVDASCGYGYGTHILSRHAGRVFGLDVNAAYINAAKKMFRSQKADFYIYKDFYSLVKAGGVPRVDKIVCVETLEHMVKSEGRAFVERMLSCLGVGGDMFLTVPLGNNAPSKYNKHHLFEPDIKHMYDSVGHAFRNMRFEVSMFQNSFGYETKYCLVTLKHLVGKL